MKTQPTNKSFLRWIGGKSQLAKDIIPRIPPHTCYCEVFGGAAWVLFKKPESKVEVLNDINSNLVKLYRVVKHHRDEFIRSCSLVPISRTEFNRFLAEPPDSSTDILGAVRYYYIVRTCFGARVNRPTFGTSTTTRSGFNPRRIKADLTLAERRLAQVMIENLPYADLIKLYDRKDPLFYVDPPYFGCENYYGKGIFAREDFTKLRDILAEIKGRFILSINDAPEIRGIFKQFRIVEVPTRYSVGVKKSKPVVELLVMNYDPAK